MNTVVVIPARMASARFPGKPLAKVCGKPLLRWPVEAAAATGMSYKVVTPDRQIADFCSGDGIPYCLDERDYPTGSDRAAAWAQDDWGAVIVLQCDEWQVTGEDLERLAKEIRRPTQMATFSCPLGEGELHDRNVTKAIVGTYDRAVHFSRGSMAGADAHVGVYAYGADCLAAFHRLPQGRLELTEDLEQLRLLERSWPIYVLPLGRRVNAINIPSDVPGENSPGQVSGRV